MRMCIGVWAAMLMFGSMWATNCAEADDLKVMSFNIRYGTANDGKDAWPLRKELVLKTIQDFGPDLLGTQETLPMQADYLKEHLTGFEYIGWSRDASNNGEQCGILYRRDRFEVIRTGQFWLSETPDEKYSKSWDSSLPRVVTWCHLKDRKNGDRELIFANTHFDHQGETARQESAKLIRRRIAEHVAALPIVLTGDFNCGDESVAFKDLTGDHFLRDTYRQLHGQKGPGEGTFHGFSGKPGDARIDWILTTKHFETKTAAIMHDHDGDRYPSDHFPVSAELKWAD
ncbi:MAG: endonuclease/exonuclease/phosphatase family protein [Planctomycetaceae bacterium]